MEGSTRLVGSRRFGQTCLKNSFRGPGVATLVAMMIEFSHYNTPSINLILLGGAGLRPEMETIRRLRKRKSAASLVVWVTRPFAMSSVGC